RMAAQYGEGANVFGSLGPEGTHRKWQILKDHCEAGGRPYDEIERIVLVDANLKVAGGTGRDEPAALVEAYGELGDAGAQHIVISDDNVWEPGKVELMGKSILPQLRAL